MPRLTTSFYIEIPTSENTVVVVRFVARLEFAISTLKIIKSINEKRDLP